MATRSLSSLPADILFCVADTFQNAAPIDALARTDRRLYSILNSYLYQHDMRLSKISALCWAAWEGRIETAVRCLLEGADVNAKTDFYAPLAWAARCGHLEIVKFLLEQEGVDVNITKQDCDNTALNEAAHFGHVGVVKALIEHPGVKLNEFQSACQRTALGCAVTKGHSEIVKLLLNKQGVDISATFHDGPFTPFRDAVRQGRTDLVKLFLEVEGFDVNERYKDGQLALIWAMSNKSVELVKLLLERKEVDVGEKDEEGETALLRAVQGESSNLQVIELLLDAGAKADGQDVVQTAADTGRRDVMKLLIERGANVNARGVTRLSAIEEATYSGDAGMVELLLENGADPNAHGEWDVSRLAWNAHEEPDGAYQEEAERHQAAQKVLMDHGVDLYGEDEEDDGSSSSL